MSTEAKPGDVLIELNKDDNPKPLQTLQQVPVKVPEVPPQTKALLQPAGGADIAGTDAGGSQVSRLDKGVRVANSSLFAINLLIGVICLCFVCVLLIFAIIDVARFSKLQKDERSKLEKGVKLLIKDSLLFKVLSYAHITVSPSNNLKPADTEPFFIYYPLTIGKLIFTFISLSITIALYLFAYQLYFTIEKIGMEGVDNDGVIKGLGMGLYASITMILFLKLVYVKMFQNGILTDIQSKYTMLATLDDNIYNHMTTNNTFYTYLVANNISQIEKELGNHDENEIIKQVVTLNLYEYFKSIVPSFDTSDIRNLFTYDAVQKRTIRPSFYLRLDCSHHIKNIFHAMDVQISPENQVMIESEISAKMAKLNQTIARVKLEAQPLTEAMFNYMKVTATFFLFVVFFAIVMLSKVYHAEEQLKNAVVGVFNGMKAIVDFIAIKIKAIFSKSQ